jgi:lysophospholipase L1-like esterase
MSFASLLHAKQLRSRQTKPPATCHPAVEPLETRTVLTAALRIAAMGDSLTAPYTGEYWGSNGDLSWVQQLQALRPGQITIYNEAVAGATSADVISRHQRQAETVASLVARRSVDDVVLIVGANDIVNNAHTVVVGDPTAVINSIVSNIQTALNTVTAAGSVGIVLGNIPDLAVTPYAHSLTSNPAVLQRVSDVIAQANQRIQALATGRQIPVIDLFGANELATSNPLIVGGVQIDNLFAPDGYHPGMVGQGLLANSVLQALHVGYGVSIDSLPLSDQEILTEANISHDPGLSYFDVSGFIIYTAPPQSPSGGAQASTAILDPVRLFPAQSELAPVLVLDHVFADGDNTADNLGFELEPAPV